MSHVVNAFHSLIARSPSAEIPRSKRGAGRGRLRVRRLRHRVEKDLRSCGGFLPQPQTVFGHLQGLSLASGAPGAQNLPGGVGFLDGDVRIPPESRLSAVEHAARSRLQGGSDQGFRASLQQDRHDVGEVQRSRHSQ